MAAEDEELRQDALFALVLLDQKDLVESYATAILKDVGSGSDIVEEALMALLMIDRFEPANLPAWVKQPTCPQTFAILSRVVLAERQKRLLMQP